MAPVIEEDLMGTQQPQPQAQKKPKGRPRKYPDLSPASSRKKFAEERKAFVKTALEHYKQHQHTQQ